MLIIEPIVLLLAVIIAFLFIRSVKNAIMNTIMGLIILALFNLFLNLGIPYSTWVILICAIGGIPGAILVIVFHILGIAF